MASMECGRNDEVAAQLSLEQKSRLDEVIKQAESSLVSEEHRNQCLAVVAENEGLDMAATAKVQAVALGGSLYNYTKGTLTTSADMQQQYAGHTVTDYPNTLDGGRTGNFYMAAHTGVEAAVVYLGKNNCNGDDCGWLLGFRAQGAGQVYVVCGPTDDFITVDWANIKTKIERSGSEGNYKDQITGTEIYACIRTRTNGDYYVSVSYYG